MKARYEAEGDKHETDEFLKPIIVDQEGIIQGMLIIKIYKMSALLLIINFNKALRCSPHITQNGQQKYNFLKHTLHKCSLPSSCFCFGLPVLKKDTGSPAIKIAKTI